MWSVTYSISICSASPMELEQRKPRAESPTRQKEGYAGAAELTLSAGARCSSEGYSAGASGRMARWGTGEVNTMEVLT